jgi:hypothetical protein
MARKQTAPAKGARRVIPHKTVLYIPEDLTRAFKKYAAQQEKTMSALVREMMEARLREEGGKRNN